jgi:hypothetical protein
VIWDAMGHGKSLGSFDGPPIFCMSTVGPPNKNPCMSTSKNKDINNKSKQNYPNYQIQMMLLKPVLCLYNNKKWSNHSKYNQLESSSVSMCWSSWVELCMSIQCSVYLQCSFLQCSFLHFYYKSVFSQFRLGGS